MRQNFGYLLSIGILSLLLNLKAHGATTRGTCQVTFHTHLGPLVVHAEAVTTPHTRSQGLMYRKHLGPMAGMLFVFPNNAPRTFWMKNTYLPLDMIFLDPKGRVVGIVHEAEPMTTHPQGVKTPAQYVVEVNGGWAKRYGIALGTQTTLTPQVQATY